MAVDFDADSHSLFDKIVKLYALDLLFSEKTICYGFTRIKICSDMLMCHNLNGTEKLCVMGS